MISEKLIIGWREWVSLPELGIEKIKAKIDTGARTSALHAFKLEPYTHNNKEKIKFLIHPQQYSNQAIITCQADIADIRWITDSGGHAEERYVINTLLVVGNFSKVIEITLTNRDSMKFRMLLGRTALKKDFLINPSTSYRTIKS